MYHNNKGNFQHPILEHILNKGVCHCLAIYIKKYLKAKEKNYEKTQIFHHAKIIPNLQKNRLKETKIL
jgi:hypothetical protein